MIYGIVGWQDCGKSLLARVHADEAVFKYGMKPVVANMRINDMHGSLSLSNEEMREWVKRMVSEGYTNQVVIIDEIDRVFPARFWKDSKQTESLVGLWQDEKLGNCIFYTAHQCGVWEMLSEGKGMDIALVVDKMVRDATRVLALPEYYPEYDVLEFMELDGRYGTKCVKTVNNVSRWFPKYDRWEVIK